MNILFKSLTATPLEALDRLKFGIQWELAEDTVELPTDFEFEVQRSESPIGPFSAVSPAITDTFFVDNTINRLSKNREVFYRVLARHVPSSAEVLSTDQDSAPFRSLWDKDKPVGSVNGFEEIISGIVGFSSNEADLILMEIIRRNNLLLRRKIGIPVGIRKERHSGIRCGLCWNEILRRTTRTRCPRCFGTGFENGYYSQINAFINFEPDEKDSILLDTGESEPSQDQAWMSNFPLLEPRDLIVDRLGNRWIVLKVKYTEKRRIISRQILLLRQINPADDNLYEVPFEEIIILEDSPYIGMNPKGGSGLL